MGNMRVGRRGPLDSEVGAIENVFVVLTNIHTGERRVHKACNIVTDAGDEHYAQRGAGEDPDQFDTGSYAPAMELGSAGDTPGKSSNRSNVTTKISSSLKTIDSGYPKTDDDDTYNPGSPDVDVVTWRVSYTTSEANDSAIDRVIITNYQSGSPGASEPVLCYAVFTASWEKTSSDLATVYVNHEMLGA